MDAIAALRSAAARAAVSAMCLSDAASAFVISTCALMSARVATRASCSAFCAVAASRVSPPASASALPARSASRCNAPSSLAAPRTAASDAWYAAFACRCSAADAFTALAASANRTRYSATPFSASPTAAVINLMAARCSDIFCSLRVSPARYSSNAARDAVTAALACWYSTLRRASCSPAASVTARLRCSVSPSALLSASSSRTPAAAAVSFGCRPPSASRLLACSPMRDSTASSFWNAGAARSPESARRLMSSRSWLTESALAVVT